MAFINQISFQIFQFLEMTLALSVDETLAIVVNNNDVGMWWYNFSAHLWSRWVVVSREAKKKQDARVIRPTRPLQWVIYMMTALIF